MLRTVRVRCVISPRKTGALQSPPSLYRQSCRQVLATSLCDPDMSLTLTCHLNEMASSIIVKFVSHERKTSARDSELLIQLIGLGESAFPNTVETAYKVYVCPRGNLLYMQIYLITDLQLL